MATGALLATTPCFAEIDYLTAYGKAEAEYSHWLAEAMRDGKKPSAEERRQMHKQYFAEAQKAYVREAGALRQEIIQLGKQVMRDLKNYNPPAKSLADGDKEKSIRNMGKSFEEPAPATKTAAPSAAAASRTIASGDVKSGAAESVSFKNAAAPAAAAGSTAAVNTVAAPAPAAAPAGDSAGAAAVSFSAAPAPAAAPAAAAPAPAPASAEPSASSQVSFGAPAAQPAAAPVAAPKK